RTPPTARRGTWLLLRMPRSPPPRRDMSRLPALPPHGDVARARTVLALRVLLPQTDAHSSAATLNGVPLARCPRHRPRSRGPLASPTQTQTAPTTTRLRKRASTPAMASSAPPRGPALMVLSRAERGVGAPRLPIVGPSAWVEAGSSAQSRANKQRWHDASLALRLRPCTVEPRRPSVQPLNRV